jgi:hypothetical protein
MVAQLTAFDKMAGELVVEIHAKTAELRELNSKLQQTDTATEESK